MQPRLKIVLDTSVLVSAFLKSGGNEAFVLDLCLADKILLCFTESIFTEYDEVLHRPKFELDPKLLGAALSLIKAHAIQVKPTQTLSVCSDPDDNQFVECAEAAEADFLVTGNKRHFPKNWGRTRIVNASELITIITPELKR